MHSDEAWTFSGRSATRARCWVLPPHSWVPRAALTAFVADWKMDAIGGFELRAAVPCLLKQLAVGSDGCVAATIADQCNIAASRRDSQHCMMDEELEGCASHIGGVGITWTDAEIFTKLNRAFLTHIVGRE